MNIPGLNWVEGEPIVSLTGVDDPGPGEALLAEFRSLCHRQYIASSAAIVGLARTRERFASIPQAQAGGTIGYVSRASDFAKPPLGQGVPQMDISQHALALEEDGEFTQYQHAALIVFLFQTWEDRIRPDIAEHYQVEVQRVRSQLMGDLRHVRNDIIHHQGRVTCARRIPFLAQIWKVNRTRWIFVDQEMRRLLDQLSAIRVAVEN